MGRIDRVTGGSGVLLMVNGGYYGFWRTIKLNESSSKWLIFKKLVASVRRRRGVMIVPREERSNQTLKAWM